MWWDDLLKSFFIPSVSRFLIPFACIAFIGAILYWLLHFYD